MTSLKCTRIYSYKVTLKGKQMMMRPLNYSITFFILFFTHINSSAQSVMLINSYHAKYLWSMECRTGFEEHIDPQHQITYFEMDTKRIPQTEYKQRVNNIWQKIEANKPDLIVTMDDNALKYLGQKIADTGVPLVFMGVNANPRLYFKSNQLPTNVAGVLERPLLKQNIVLLSKILPNNPNKVLLLMDNGMTSSAIIESTMEGKISLNIGGIDLDVSLLNNYADWQTKIKSLSSNDYDALIISNYGNLRDKNNQQVPVNNISKWTSSNSARPVFALWKNSVGKEKAIGGLLLNGYEQGKKAAEITNTALKTGKLPYYLVPKHGEYTFSTHELSRWNLTLPESIKSRARFID